MSDDKIPGLGDLYLLNPQDEKMIKILNQLPVYFLTDDGFKITIENKNGKLVYKKMRLHSNKDL